VYAVGVASVAMAGVVIPACAGAFFVGEIVHQSDCTRMGPPAHSLHWEPGRSELRARQALKSLRANLRFALLRE
jgi:hypothetical protein